MTLFCTQRMFHCGSVALVLMLLLFGGCLSIPEGVEPVQGFAIAGYLGTWYEVARLDHVFERGLSRVSAHYSLREDGSIRVVNRGYSAEKREWKSVEGRAKFVQDRNTGYLKVSFFGPFYSSYVIFELGDNYEYAFVSGYKKDYLWLLSRQPGVSREVFEDFRKKAKSLGFNTDELIMIAPVIKTKKLCKSNL